MNATELKFVPSPSLPPNATCNLCGQVLGATTRHATIDVTDDADYTVFVCSSFCEDAFKKHPGSSEYLAMRIAEIRNIHFHNK